MYRFAQYQKEFTEWLARYLKSEPADIDRFLKKPETFEFLITWSLFESECLGKHLDWANTQKYALYLSQQSDIQNDIESYFKHFYHRLQNKKNLQSLLHGEDLIEAKETFSRLIKQPPTHIDYADKVLFALLMLRRYHQNIFYGDKAFRSWKHNATEMRLCSKLMQSCINLAQSKQSYH